MCYFRLLSVAIAAAFFGSGCSHLGPAASSSDAEAEIRAVLTCQTRAWNQGDLNAFMETYVKSEDLRLGRVGCWLPASNPPLNSA